MGQSTSPAGSSAGGESAASTGPANDPATGPGTGPGTPTSSASPVDTAGTPDDRSSGSDATGAGAGDVTPQDGTSDGGPGAATSGGADATVTRADAPDPDEADDEPGAAQAHRPSADDADQEAERESEADRQQRLDEFAKEHDPDKHDIAAGEEFRQRGDWTADAAGGEQKWNADGELVEGSSPAVPQTGEGDDDESAGPAGSDDSGSSPATDAGAGTETDNEVGAGAQELTGGRRTSSFEEIRDGGYSVGSAAPLEDGAMPMGHPVKGWEGSKTYAAPGDEKYDTGEPHVWFTDEGAAERAGFTRA